MGYNQLHEWQTKPGILGGLCFAGRHSQEFLSPNTAAIWPGLIIFFAQEGTTIDLGKLIADNSLAIILAVFIFLVVWKVLPFYLSRENKREDFRLAQEAKREAERSEREKALLEQQKEYARMVQGFEETVRTGNKASVKSNNALIETLGKMAMQIESQGKKIDNIAARLENNGK